MALLIDPHEARFPERAVVLPGGNDVPEPPYSSCFHLDSKGKACFSAAGVRGATGFCMGRRWGFE